MTSTPLPDPASTQETAGQLTDALERMTGQLEQTNTELAQARADSETRDAALTRYGHRNRVLIAVDVVLTLIIAAMAFWISSAATSAANANARSASAQAAETALYQANLNSCYVGNQYRAGVIASINRLVMLLEGPHPSARTRAAAGAYEAYVYAQNQPRDCTRAYPLPAKGATGG